ncbi:hypothetical protein [Georgenia sp. SUBG003]|uniref:hypothetical protein n=1 Tax=Georgenia sp. SUBG003 TaxID=1497974 RepID=UPI003AB5E649
MVALAVGLALAVVWELGEWAGHTYLDPAIFVSYDDTIGDLAAGGAGAAVAGAWLFWCFRHEVLAHAYVLNGIA